MKYIHIFLEWGELFLPSFLFLNIAHLHTHKRTRSYITLHPIDSFISTNMLVSVLTEIGLMWHCQSIAMKEPIEMIHKWISLGLRSVRFLSILRAFTNAHNHQCHCHWNSGSKAFEVLLKIASLWQIYNKQQKDRSSISTLFLKKKEEKCVRNLQINKHFLLKRC